eukprot:6183176-Pleurochrysis_carterae.AAC.5
MRSSYCTATQLKAAEQRSSQPACNARHENSCRARPDLARRGGEESSATHFHIDTQSASNPYCTCSVDGSKLTESGFALFGLVDLQLCPAYSCCDLHPIAQDVKAEPIADEKWWARNVDFHGTVGKHAEYARGAAE